jgi:nucleoside-diphosphate-sugar epimerase
VREIRIVITGGEGYIGRNLQKYISQVAPTHQWRILSADIRASEPIDITTRAGLLYIDEFKPTVIINLAGVSGRAACGSALASEVTAVNTRAVLRMRERYSEALIIQASSCSCLAGEIDLYGRSKLASERSLQMRAGPSVIFRLGTVVGLGLVPDGCRWDLPVHKMVKDAVEKKVISIPEQKLDRPWLFIEDLCDVIYRTVSDYEAGATFAHVGRLGNLPLASENNTLKAMAQIVTGLVPGTELLQEARADDLRSYNVPCLLSTNISVVDQIYGLVRYLI